ncbi:MAG: hypothetical protein OXE53_09055 [Deltaproteobacteria bacterium]|nr:hypothetical protein [Deltaproteobacteria bacterium]
MSPAQVAAAARSTGAGRAAHEEKANRAIVEMSDLFAQIMYGLVVQKDKDEHKVIRLCVDTGGKKKQAEPVRAELKHMKNEAEALAAFCNEIPQSILCTKL